MVDGLIGEHRDWTVLDVGCGRGDQVQLFAEKLDRGRVAAIDLNPDRIRDVERRFVNSELQTRIAARVGDALKLPYEDGAFDLAWSSHTMHILPEPVVGVRELVRVVRPGGFVAVREDRFLDRLLPMDIGLGDPGLEERSIGHFAAWFANDRKQRGPVPHGWMEVLRQSGLRDVTARSFMFERVAPFSATEIEYLRERKIRALIRDETSPEDRAVIEQLADPKSPHDFARRTDLYFVSVATVYSGKKI